MKKSDLNIVSNIGFIVQPPLKYASDRMSMASGSRGGVYGHDGTGGSSATKKLYMCRARNLGVACWSQMMSTMSPPLNLPVCPRNVISPSSWS